jgi:hypothetical protein
MAPGPVGGMLSPGGFFGPVMPGFMLTNSAPGGVFYVDRNGFSPSPLVMTPGTPFAPYGGTLSSGGLGGYRGGVIVAGGAPTVGATGGTLTGNSLGGARSGVIVAGGAPTVGVTGGTLTPGTGAKLAPGTGGALSNGAGVALPNGTIRAPSAPVIVTGGAAH